MPKLIAITMGVVATVLASVWFSRRRAFDRMPPVDRRNHQPPQSADEEANHHADAGLTVSRMNLESADESRETPHEPTNHPPAPEFSNTTFLPAFPTEVVGASATSEVETQFPLVLEYLSEESAVATPAEPIGAHPSANPVLPLSANGFLRDRGDEDTREPKRKQSRLSSPRTRGPQDEGIVEETGTPTDLWESPKTAALIPPSELTGTAEEMSGPKTAMEGAAQPRASDERSAASSSHRTSSSTRKAEAASGDRTKPPNAVNEPVRKPRAFSEPVPSPTQKNATRSERTSDLTPRNESSLPIRLQLVFGSSRNVKRLVLIPHRGEGMPGSFEVTTVAGDRFDLSEASSDSYESLAVSLFDNPLSNGVVFQACSEGRRWRWELTRREIYVLAAGDAFGLSGFVTRHRDQRLWLNSKHVVLAKEGLRDQVMGALSEAGCGEPEVCDSASAGVPAGWIVIRDVVPTRAVPMREEQNILNVLCPGHEIEPQLLGGIRLERNVWLVGFPPRIRFAGELENDFRVLIDNEPATRCNDGGFESPGWDREGEHRLWFSDRAQTYALRTMEERWDSWPAHPCDAGEAICGAGTYRIESARRWRQFCIPAANPILIGARPGEIFRCRMSNGVNSGWVVTAVPFTPVWALPGSRSSRKNPPAVIELVEFREPLNQMEESSPKLKVTSALRKWVFAVRNARRNQLTLAVHGDETDALWRRYGDVARRLRKQLR